MKKIKLKVLACYFEVILTNFENPSGNPLQRPYRGDFDSINAYRKPPVTSYILRSFLAANERSALENVRPITDKGILNRVSVSIFKIRT
jgi:hypothetical protein